MTDARRAVFALGVVVCLIVIAAALPAADPRLDPPGSDDGDVVAGQWDPSEENAADPVEQADDTSTEEAADEESDDRPIEIRGSPIPGTKVTVKTESSGPWETDTDTITVDGEVVGDTDPFGQLEIDVPYAEEMTVSIEGEDTSRTVDIETNATIYEQSTPTPNGTLSITASVEADPVVGAGVTVDGESVASTNTDGEATVPLPPSAGTVEIGIERGAVTAERTVTVSEPTVTFATPMLFPGFPAPVVVSADGAPIEDATVEIGGESAGTTGGDGRTTVWLPVEDVATVTATVGTESATTTVGNLYFRLAAVVVVVPGFVIGGALTYLKLAALRERRRADGLTAVFVGLADVLEGVSGAIGHLRPALGNVWSSVPSIAGLSLGRGRWRFPALGRVIATASLGGFAATLPSLGSLRDAVSGSSNSSTTGGLRSNRVLEWLSGDETDEADDAGVEGPSSTGETVTPRSPREEIRVAWHVFLERLDVRNRETTTPGTVARRAIGAGFPADSVRRLLGIVREVEYGDREPSPDRVASARAAADSLLAFEADEDDPAHDGDDSPEVSEE